MCIKCPEGMKKCELIEQKISAVECEEDLLLFTQNSVNSCVKQCPSGTYQNIRVCSSCEGDCKECSTSATKCTSCINPSLTASWVDGICLSMENLDDL
jgi:hypothetical protein